MSVREYIPLEECEDLYLYKIKARNFKYGVYDVKQKGFIGVREKGGETYLFLELHWDKDKQFGTAKPKRRLEKCPHSLEEWFKNSFEETDLFNWIKERSN